SLWQTPQACTLIRTSRAPGSGISRSTISKSPLGLEICAAIIGASDGFAATLSVAINPPASFSVVSKHYPCRRGDRSILPGQARRPSGSLKVANRLLDLFSRQNIVCDVAEVDQSRSISVKLGNLRGGGSVRDYRNFEPPLQQVPHVTLNA